MIQSMPVWVMTPSTPVLAMTAFWLALAVLGMGLYPQPFAEIMHASVNELLKHLSISKL